MKRYISIFMFACLTAVTASAQVERSVEVTKNYFPEISTSATKLSITPNMVDTVRLRPEIDYTIIPKSFASTLGTHRFRPASLTYWEYRKPHPFYVKLGVGYPLNTSGDLYVTTHRAGVGYLTGYVNHRGQFGRIKYQDIRLGKESPWFKDNRSLQMKSRIGAQGGMYFDRYILSGDLYYNTETYSRFPLPESTAYDRRSIDFENIKLDMRFGDSFVDMSRLNFVTNLSIDFFNDKSQNPIVGDIYRQLDVTAGAGIARRISPRSEFSFDVDYKGYMGVRSIRGHQNHTVSAAVMYAYHSGRMLDLKVGFRFTYDYNKADWKKQNHYHPFPYLMLSLDVNEKGVFVPYVELDGELQNNSYHSLVKRNPYTSILPMQSFAVGLDGTTSLPNTAAYNVRLGLSGHTKSGRLAYRLYANMAFLENSLYWYNVNQLFFNAETARRNIWSLCAAVDYKPISQLLISAHLKGMVYNNYSHVNDGLPPVEALLSLRYTHKKFSVGASAELIGTTTWTSIYDERLFDASSTAEPVVYRVKAPAAVDLSLFAEYHISPACTVFIEGNNLANMNIYRWVCYREQGASFTAGVKLKF